MRIAALEHPPQFQTERGSIKREQLGDKDQVDQVFRPSARSTSVIAAGVSVQLLGSLPRERDRGDQNLTDAGETKQVGRREEFQLSGIRISLPNI